mmetsp:Transcript_6785/g.19544  ORF Transcript_6785/g.19544 Transcript_6785/m.19544 type:complete len:83 (+) Transcript_6785:157-405(+)
MRRDISTTSLQSTSEGDRRGRHPSGCGNPAVHPCDETSGGGESDDIDAPAIGGELDEWDPKLKRDSLSHGGSPSPRGAPPPA